jgi:hypothetical protein
MIPRYYQSGTLPCTLPVGHKGIQELELSVSDELKPRCPALYTGPEPKHGHRCEQPAGHEHAHSFTTQPGWVQAWGDPVEAEKTGTQRCDRVHWRFAILEPVYYDHQGGSVVAGSPGVDKVLDALDTALAERDAARECPAAEAAVRAIVKTPDSKTISDLLALAEEMMNKAPPATPQHEPLPALERCPKHLDTASMWGVHGCPGCMGEELDAARECHRNRSEDLAHANAAHAKTLAALNSAVAKWTTYEREYILPVFDWAAKHGIQLKELVAANPGKNCVQLFFEALEERLTAAEAAGDEWKRQVKIGVDSEIEARKELERVRQNVQAARTAAFEQAATMLERAGLQHRHTVDLPGGRTQEWGWIERKKLVDALRAEGQVKSVAAISYQEYKKGQP